MQVLHVMSDPRLVDPVAKAFARLRDCSSRCVVLTTDPRRLGGGFAASSKAEIVVPGTREYRDLLRGRHSVVWVHGAASESIRFVLSYARKTVVVWSALGPDYRDYVGIWGKRPAETLRWLRQTPLKRVVKRVALFGFAKTGWIRKLDSEHACFFRRVDFYVPVMPGSETALAGLVGPEARRLDFAYDGRGRPILRGLAEELASCPARVVPNPFAGAWASSPPKAVKKLKVSFSANGGVGQPMEMRFLRGDAIRLPPCPFTRSGFRFAGWTYSPTADAVWPAGSSPAALPFRNGVASLYARWTGEPRMVVFHACGGRGKMKSFFFRYGSPTALPPVAFTRTMCDFAGWAFQPQGKVNWADRGVILHPPVGKDGCCHLYAKWRGRRCRVRFDANGGAGHMADFHFTYDSPTRLPANVFTRRFAFNGFEFAGWSKTRNGAVCWKDRAPIRVPPVVDGVATLYAVWKGFPCTVQFKANGGAGRMPDFCFVYGKAARLPAMTFHRAHHAFAGWAADAYGKVNWPDGGWIVLPPHRAGKVVLFAKWKGDPCRIRFDANGGEGEMADFTFDYDERLFLPPSAFTRPSFGFMGWATTPTGPVRWRDGDPLGDAAFENGEMTLYARWRNDASVAAVPVPVSGNACEGFGPRRPMRILHFVGARLFVDGIIETFESVPETANRYVLVTGEWPYSTAGIRHVDKLEIIRRHSDRHQALLEATDYDVVWVHGASQDSIRFCHVCSPKAFVVWSTWGYDYIDYVGRWWFLPSTTWIWLRHTSPRQVVKMLALWFIAKVRINRLSRSEHGRFFRRVDFFSCVLQEEGAFIRRLVNPQAQQIFYAYLVNLREKARTSGPLVDLDRKGIWVGNSATLSNNYWDIFPRLVSSRDYEVIASLVYGPDGVTRGPYAEMIEAYGRKCLGDRFSAITTFLPLAEYTKVMDKCCCFVFGQLRQQAVGNVLLALKRGGCVFLHRNSPVYAFCLRKGFRVYTLEDIDRGLATVVEDFRPYQKATAAAANKASSTREILAKIRKSVRQIKGEFERRQAAAQDQGPVRTIRRLRASDGEGA